MADHHYICSSIESGAATADGSQIMINAPMDGGNVSILFPSDEAPRAVSLILALLGDARAAARDPQSSPPPVFNAGAIEFLQRPDQGRDVLRIQVGEDRNSSLYFSFPLGYLVEVSKGILQAAGLVVEARNGLAN
ncbi:hypothetical protein [Methylocystis suflitae]|uniref:hypothetical protein n=1 Tax=Methylocystis suflitae TaxID=2951405 RepID=UPI00210A9F45|nr:hypothetical protein [Methylocystis suflitae]MCQ4188997.1 hypothetical protein [Methylocystis suflitae]